MLMRERSESGEEESDHAESEEDNDNYGKCAFHRSTLTRAQ